MLSPPDGACTTILSHPSPYQCSPSLMGDSTTNAATVDVSHARKTTAHLTLKTKVQFTKAPSTQRRGASVVSHLHSPQRFTQGQCWVLQVLTASRFTSFCALAWSQYSPPLSLASLTFHKVLALLFPLGWRTLVALFLSTNLQYRFSHSTPSTPL